MPTVDLLGTGALVALPVVALVLVLEAGLLIGLVLPAGSLVLGLGVLGGTGAVPLALVAVTVATATVLGAVLGHAVEGRRQATGSPAGGRLARRQPRIARVVDRISTPLREAVGRRPVVAAGTAQFVAVARTLAPRLAASAGVPLATMLRGTAPAAVVWSAGLVTTGALAGAALPLIRELLPLAGVPLVLAVAGWLVLGRHLRLRAVRPAPAS